MANRDEFWIELERPDGSTKRYGPTRIPFGGQTAMRNAAKRLHGDGEVGKVYLVGDKSKLRARSCWIVQETPRPCADDEWTPGSVVAESQPVGELSSAAEQ